LDLSHNNVDDDDIWQVAELMAQLPRLRLLDINGHGLSSLGLKWLWWGVSQARSLQEVDIGSLYGDEEQAMYCLYRACAGHPTLRCIHLREAYFRLASINQLTQLAQSNPPLCCILIDGNLIRARATHHQAALAELAQALANNAQRRIIISVGLQRIGGTVHVSCTNMAGNELFEQVFSEHDTVTTMQEAIRPRLRPLPAPPCLLLTDQRDLTSIAAPITLKELLVELSPSGLNTVPK
jgi:Ran GTPase-activating protein (RanGAP) involved in mRNA processing and transport